MPLFPDEVVDLCGDVVGGLWRRTAPEQGGLLGGKDPTDVNPSDPIRLWIIQLGIILTTIQLLSLLLVKLRQPRVIAEVICGILLGPTVMGRVPGFTEHIFPQESRSYLNLTSTIGLVLFLFLVGLEIDVRVIQRNARNSFIISIGAILLPLAIGFGMARPIYNNFVDPSTSTFGHFALFVAVAYSITAFPVLCRILTELNLLDTTIGIVVLSAGVGNDIVGWTLLALTVALVNAGSGLTALYILLTAIAWSLVILVPVKHAMLWIARRTGSTEKGPTPLMMTISIMLMFASAFFTDIIGVHAIFGAFLAGLAIPREGGFAIALTEKLEDVTSIIFLPLYFTLSGLSTDLGLLNDGKTWAYTIAIIATAYVGKMAGGVLGARTAGYTWRESAAVGTLLSCKGLVELIVLNIGLTAGILDTRVFSMFVLEALVLTFATTPMTLVYYPSSVRKRVTVVGESFSAVEEEEEAKRQPEDSVSPLPFSEAKLRLAVVLDKMEHIPALMTITRFLQAPRPERPLPDPSSSSPNDVPPDYPIPRVSVDALRLIELTERTSMLMKSAVSDEIIHSDSLLTMYRTFGDLHDLRVSSSLSIVTQDGFATSVAEHARHHHSDMIILSWIAPGPPGEAPSGHAPNAAPTAAASGSHNPFDAFFRTNPVPTDPSTINTEFVRRVFSESKKDVALYVDRSHLRSRGLVGVGVGVKQHVLLPFFGGPDDRLALSFVVQLCTHPGITATVIRIAKMEVDNVEVQTQRPTEAVTTDSTRFAVTVRNRGATGASRNDNSIRSTAFPDTVYPRTTTQTRLESDTADNIAWLRHSQPLIATAAHGRIDFLERATPKPLGMLIEIMDHDLVDKRLIVAVGRARRLAAHSHEDELNTMLGAGSSGTRRTVGDAAAGMLAGSKNTAALIVLQTAEESLS